MPVNRKLGRAGDKRKAILRGLVTAFFKNGRIETTWARASEVKKIVEKLITSAVKEINNFSTKEKVVSRVKLDAKGRKIKKIVKSKNGREYSRNEREVIKKEKRVDGLTRLNARRSMISVLYRIKDEDGKYIDLANKIFDEIAPKYVGRKGGYTRVYRLGKRRGDGADMALLELV